MKISEVLFKAAQIIERDGWCQNDYKNGNCLCPLGAIRVACGHQANKENSEVTQPTCEFLRDFLDKPVWCWNDAPERTAEEVIDALVIASIEAESDDRLHNSPTNGVRNG